MLEQELEARFAALPAAVWVDRLRQAGVSAHAVVPVAELMVDPWVQSHGLSVTQTVEGVGDVTMPGLSEAVRKLISNKSTPYRSLKAWQEINYPVSPFLALPRI
jgi:crotonobetainyl-CoA:carnitine CoA-transferase CaiB-like acyl-CoA transferase